MRTHAGKKLFFRLGIVMILLLMLIAESGTTLALDSLRVSIAFDQTVATIGRTPLLSIDITSGSGQPIRVTSLQCTASGGNILTSDSINPMPSSIPPSGFRTQQGYRANAPGVSQVNCIIRGVNAIGDNVVAMSNTVGVNVLSETRLYFDATSATRVATVGQMVYIMATFGNRGNTPFTNLNLSCVELGRALENVYTPPIQPVIPPGQSGFVQSQWRAARTGAGPISCQLTATDSTNGNTVSLPAPTINIEVR